MEVNGKVLSVGNTQQVSDKFKKRELILEIAENPQYPEQVKFEAQQDKVELFNSLKEGDVVNVKFNLKGKAWTNKEGVTNYFNTLSVWKIDKENSQPKQVKKEELVEASGDDLPF